MIAATNGHLLAFDNLSSLPGWLSDALCRLASGGSFALRQLYTDADEVLFQAARPTILNGIEDVITRQDLADRAIFLTMGSLRDEQRRREVGRHSIGSAGCQRRRRPSPRRQDRRLAKKSACARRPIAQVPGISQDARH